MKHGRGMKVLRDVSDSGGICYDMDTRPPAAEITNGLTTTAEKIRALAGANYDRAEISKILGIRYQHVRHVMLRSGMTSGLRREAEAEREPVEVDAAPAPREDTAWTMLTFIFAGSSPSLPPREDTAWTVLTEAGFECIGEWTHDPESLLKLDAKAPSSPGVYAFVVDDIVVYVGLTLSGLKTRFDQYRRGHKGQRTSSRINGQIAETLRAGKKVKVLVATPEPSEWQELPVNTAAGLEVGLIEMIRPSWNIRGAG
jgi:hypothetical protein